MPPANPPKWTPARIKKARGDKLQTAFAIELGVCWRTLYRWERGETTPNAALLDLWEIRKAQQGT